MSLSSDRKEELKRERANLIKSLENYEKNYAMLWYQAGSGMYSSPKDKEQLKKLSSSFQEKIGKLKRRISAINSELG